MTHPVRALQTLLLSSAFVLAACGGSGAANTHPGTGTGGTPGAGTPGATAPAPASGPASTAGPATGGTATTSCIPPGGGDHDADNSGAPSDGDGCL